MLRNIRVVLVHTTHPGNIGAVARAMKNMCLEALYLVAPQEFPSAAASARASGADDVLAAARICVTLDDALADCILVIGASARPRAIACAPLDPRRCARQAVAEACRGPVALVFGREHSGLTNEELDRCHYQVQIPCNPEFGSMNLAAAVQVIAYEVLAATREPRDEARGRAPGYASAAEMEHFFRHLEETLIDVGFLDESRPRHLMRRLRRLYGRARPDKNEINILRGILTAVAARIGRGGCEPGARGG